jgi:hyperosmotically inducible periplasmic protein
MSSRKPAAPARPRNGLFIDLPVLFRSLCEANIFAEGPEQDRKINKGAAKRSDDLIAHDVEEQLNQDTSFNPEGLNLKVDGGDVTLEGYVAHLADKTRAEEIVLEIEGVTAFHNNLRIAPERQ